MEPRPLGEPGPDERRLVGRVVVHDDVHVEVDGHALVDVVEELSELDGPVAAVRLGDHGSGLEVERCKQRRGAMPPIVVRSPFGLAGLHRQQGRRAVEGLNLGLLVDAQHHGMVGRVDVEADDVADLVNQQRVGRQLEGLAPVGTQPEAPPDATDGHATEAGRACERCGCSSASRPPGPSPTW